VSVYVREWFPAQRGLTDINTCTGNTCTCMKEGGTTGGRAGGREAGRARGEEEGMDGWMDG